MDRFRNPTSWTAIFAAATLLAHACFLLRQGNGASASVKLRHGGATLLQAREAAHVGASATVHGVICTMVKDENRHLAEWVQFHLLLGATKVVIYDDNSTISPAAALQTFADSIVIHRMQDIGDPPAYLDASHDPERPYLTRQKWAFNHCAAKYGGGHGWLAVIDTDEYIFPCRRHVSSTVWEAFQEHMSHAGAQPGAAAIQLQCLKFGFNDVNRTLLPGELQIQSHTHRAPYKELESGLQQWAQQNLTGCTPSICQHIGTEKVIYTLEAAVTAMPVIHGPAAPGVIVDTKWSRQSGVCCNHYFLRGSLPEFVEKFSKSNYTDLYQPMTLPHPSRWYSVVPDTLIWQYLVDLTKKLQKRGLVVVA